MASLFVWLPLMTAALADFLRSGLTTHPYQPGQIVDYGRNLLIASSLFIRVDLFLSAIILTTLANSCVRLNADQLEAMFSNTLCNNMWTVMTLNIRNY